MFRSHYGLANLYLGGLSDLGINAAKNEAFLILLLLRGHAGFGLLGDSDRSNVLMNIGILCEPGPSGLDDRSVFRVDTNALSPESIRLEGIIEKQAPVSPQSNNYCAKEKGSLAKRPRF
ncbi:hypothetical protein [Candidatus Synchoanobacter obligatus]|uniref:Uncharacterized protein n=1 Tax=Candidatus Synchoanobacter obligatus TaxID=2919597 RepID=A0ABT1L6R0_9GAMM|nr:hypothetical protein [Candidatus Synchoanobacter obligatus]MCP8352553.1 hypothetical protein [Candidatus Synchoanobacter obligatus]